MGIQINGQTDTITAIDGQMTISGADLSTNTLDLSTINATGVSTFAGNIDANGDLDVDGHTELDAVNVSGFLTATSAYYSGDVTVLGTLTYEDVTNVDVVGIATARSGLRVTGGGLDVVGVSTFNNDVVISSDSAQLKLGADGDAQITHNGSNLFIKNSTGQLQYRSLTHIFENAIGDTEYARITSSGNIGIGTNSTGDKLHVNGTSRFEDYLRGSSTLNKLYISDDVAITGTKKLYFDGGSNTYIDEVSADTLRFTTGGTERLRITSDGIVQVGASHSTGSYGWDPIFKVAVEEGGDASAIHFGESVNGSANPAINFLRRDGGTLWSAYAGQISYEVNKFQFKTAPNTAPGSHSYTTRMTILQGGNIGIGTDNPISELMVENATQSHITVKTSGSNMAKFGSKGNDVYVGGTAGAANIIFKRNITSIDHPADSGTETLRIDSEGNVNIGAKDYHNHGNTVDSLQIGYATNLYEDSYTSGTDNYSIWANNAYYDGSNNFYMRNDEASRIYQNSGNFYFDNAPSGTADTAITFTTRLRITPSGQVAVNGGNPNANWGPFNVNVDGSNIMHIGYGANYDNYFTTGSSGTQIFRTASIERFRIGADGQIGLGGANYGTSGQVLTSQGSSAAPQWATPAGGKILQVKQTVKYDQASFANNSGAWSAVPGLSVSITPSSTSSKVLVSWTVTSSMFGNDAMRIYRGSTPIFLGNADGNRLQCTAKFYAGQDHRYSVVPYSGEFLDSPSTTSAVTYQVYVEATNTIWINRSFDGDNNTERGVTASSITVKEIGA